MNNQNLEQLNKRDFDECYFCLYCVSLDIFMSLEHGKVEKQNIYVFYGFWTNNFGQKSRHFSYQLKLLSVCF